MKYLDPAWHTNPVLAQIREALQEVEHIRMALKDLERLASAPARPPSDLRFLVELLGKVALLQRLHRLDGWSASLTESEIGLWAMIAHDAHKADAFPGRRKRFIDKQELKWDAIMDAASVAKPIASLVRALT